MLAGLLLTAPAIAADNVPPPPDDLPGLDPNQPMPEDTVTIIRRESTVIEEHRINGQLRYAKVTPKSGPPYYLYDSDGDGILDSRHNDLDNPPIQRWILFSW
ncbi:MAG: DUF2782 domain-containing protein [Gammaproteobacteria bacterium]